MILCGEVYSDALSVPPRRNDSFVCRWQTADVTDYFVPAARLTCQQLGGLVRLETFGNLGVRHRKLLFPQLPLHKQLVEAQRSMDPTCRVCNHSAIFRVWKFFVGRSHSGFWRRRILCHRTFVNCAQATVILAVSVQVVRLQVVGILSGLSARQKLLQSL
jgi:hypothetical protein